MADSMVDLRSFPMCAILGGFMLVLINLMKQIAYRNKSLRTILLIVSKKMVDFPIALRIKVIYFILFFYFHFISFKQRKISIGLS